MIEGLFRVLLNSFLILRTVLQALLVQGILNQFYPNPPIPLNHKSPFTLLVAVVLSAQTTDGKVNAATEKLFQLADTPEAMRKLNITEIQGHIREVGLAPSKSKYLHGNAHFLSLLSAWMNLYLLARSFGDDRQRLQRPGAGIFGRADAASWSREEDCLCCHGSLTLLELCLA